MDLHRKSHGSRRHLWEQPQEALSIQFQPKETQLKCESQETQPCPENGDERDFIGKERRRREYKGHIVGTQKLAILTSQVRDLACFTTYKIRNNNNLPHKVALKVK